MASWWIDSSSNCSSSGKVMIHHSMVRKYPPRCRSVSRLSPPLEPVLGMPVHVRQPNHQTEGDPLVMQRRLLWYHPPGDVLMMQFCVQSSVHIARLDSVHIGQMPTCRMYQ